MSEDIDWDGKFYPSAAGLPHLITALDADFVRAIISINGAKPGLYGLPAPYDEGNLYEPFRENVPLHAWALPYNQNEVLSGLCLGADTPFTVIDCSVDEALLKDLNPEPDGNGVVDVPDLASLLAKIGWVLFPFGEERDRGLFVVSAQKGDYMQLAREWCHRHGRSYLTMGQQKLSIFPAPESARRNVVLHEGSEFLAKMALFGIDPREVLSRLSDEITEKS